MSWARFGDDSDVYIFDDCRGGITCCSCQLKEKVDTIIPGFQLNADYNCQTEAEMYIHLREHLKAGHKIPDYLQKELNEKS